MPSRPARYSKASYIVPIISLGILLWVMNLPVDGNPLFKLTAETMALFAFAFYLKMPRKDLERKSWDLPVVSEETPVSRLNQYSWFIVVGALLAGTLGYFEYKQPYLFMQVDNHDQFMPVILQAMRGFFDDGIFPTWNGYQQLGVPTTSIGYFALTYPPLYAFYALARYGFHNEFLTLEFLIWFHLLAGYALSFQLFRRLYVRPVLAASAAFCFTMTGHNIMYSQYYYHMSATAMYLPLLGLSLVTLIKGSPKLGWVVWTALTIGFYFHTGSAQMWVYGMMFWGICACWIIICNRSEWRSYLRRACMAVFIGLALAMPLLVVQFLQTINTVRLPWDINISPMADKILFPWAALKSATISTVLLQDYITRYNHLCFFGSVFAFAYFVRLALELASFSRMPRLTPQMGTTGFSIAALIALTLAMGSQAKLWDWLAIIPPFSKFREPLKMLPFVAFFMILSSAPLIERLVSRLRWPTLTRTSLSLLAIGLMLLSYKGESLADFWVDTVYPELPANQKPLQAIGFTTVGRVFPIYMPEPRLKNFSLTLAVDYPTFYQIPDARGYDFGLSLESTLPENLQASAVFWRNPIQFANEFGIQWVTIPVLSEQKTEEPPLYADNPIYASSAQMIRAFHVSETDFGTFRGFHIASSYTKPMAYIEKSEPVPLLYRMRTDGIDVKVGTFDPNDMLIVNFLNRSWFSGTNDKGQKLSVSGDEFGRIAVRLPEGTHGVSLRFKPPWNYGFALAFVLLIAAGALYRYDERKSRNQA